MKQLYTVLLASATLFCTTGTAHAQGVAGGNPPANDECSAAQPVAVVYMPDCATSMVSGNNIASVVSTGDPTCDNSTSGYEDVWYSFNSGADTTVRVELVNGSAADLNFAVQATCGPGAEVACEIGPFVPIDVTVVPNTDYYIRVFSNLDYGVGGDFTLCVSHSAALVPPPNDDCSSAIMLTPATICSPVAGTTAGAGQSMAPTACNGGASANANDVWYSFTATTANDTILVEGIDDFDAVVELFSGACGSLTTLACENSNFPQGEPVSERLFFSGLTVGSLYYIRVYDYGHFSAAHNFNICVKSDASSGICESTRPDLTVYPNPSDGELNISGPMLNGVSDIDITDLAGRVIYTHRAAMHANLPITLPLGGKLAPGTYLLRLAGLNGISSGPVVIR